MCVSKGALQGSCEPTPHNLFRAFLVSKDRKRSGACVVCRAVWTVDCGSWYRTRPCGVVAGAVTVYAMVAAVAASLASHDHEKTHTHTAHRQSDYAASVKIRNANRRRGRANKGLGDVGIGPNSRTEQNRAARRPEPREAESERTVSPIACTQGRSRVVARRTRLRRRPRSRPCAH